MIDYEPVIGMEVHAELLTESKMFCKCEVSFGGAPNTRVCPVCLGLPGSLPVANEKAVEYVVRAALALNCTISQESLFHRKNYFYPDMAKNYQISQYDNPIGLNGWIDITVNGDTKRIRIRRVHLEEDTGKLIHAGGNESLVDYNRSGLPLMEIVTEADIHSADEAREYLVRLRAILTYLGVNDGKMEEGSLRCEPNISVRQKGTAKLGTKTELKNLNSFRAVYSGVLYETERQTAVLNEGGKVIQETRRWDDAKNCTSSMRVKELEQEYRYFPDPDLVALNFTPEYIEHQKSLLPELPAQRQARLMEKWSLPAYDAEMITDSKAMADFFEETVAICSDAKTVSNWIMGDLTKMLNASGTDIADCKIKPADFAKMLALIQNGTISGKIAKSVFDDMFETGKSPDDIVKSGGMTQISDEQEILGVIDRVLSENADAVVKINSGDQKPKGFLVGQIMKHTQGRANPEVVNRLLRSRLSESAS